MSIKPIYLYIIGGVFALILAFALFSWLGGDKSSSGAKLSKKGMRAEVAKIDKQHQRAKEDTLRAAALGKKAEHTEVNIQAMRKQAAIIHAKSVTHATPIPTTPAAVADLQHFLDTYGDSTSNR